MNIKFYKKITIDSYKEDILELLSLCDHEFVPALSARSSTTQANLLPGQKSSKIPEAYFENIINQNNFLAIEDNKVIGFMSFKINYVCENISTEYSPNIYVTTIIVHPNFRHQGIAGKFYDSLMKKFKHHYIFTRTWSTNSGHLRILNVLKFHQHCYLSNDRGPGIDTVYYRFDPNKNTLKEYINQYRLGGNIFFSTLLLIISIICLLLWYNSKTDESRELWIAISTSLMASFLCLISDTFIKIRESKNDTFISKFKSFGIEDLHFDKSEVLTKLIPHCREEIWISGYRLIMTSKPRFRQALLKACKDAKNLKIKILVIPPWSETYKLTYGDDDTSINYLTVFKDLCECIETEKVDLEIRFANHPLFSDTYKVDNRFITGSYLNCMDKFNTQITAKDFFTLDIVGQETPLYELIRDDYLAVWNLADYKLDNILFNEKIKSINDFHKLNSLERFELIQSCCIKLNN